jgi:hypothetical protein
MRPGERPVHMFKIDVGAFQRFALTWAAALARGLWKGGAWGGKPFDCERFASPDGPP